MFQYISMRYMYIIISFTQRNSHNWQTYPPLSIFLNAQGNKFDEYYISNIPKALIVTLKNV